GRCWVSGKSRSQEDPACPIRGPPRSSMSRRSSRWPVRRLGSELQCCKSQVSKALNTAENLENALLSPDAFLLVGGQLRDTPAVFAATFANPPATREGSFIADSAAITVQVLCTVGICTG